MPGKLILIPNSLGNPDPDTFLPLKIKNQITTLEYFIVENTRNARRYLKSIDQEVDIDALTFYELNKHTDPLEISSFLQPIDKGFNVGVLSEAGLPGIADPGAAVVRLAHQRKIEVLPFTGPSSIFLALMASGLNGQSFRFIGYLPVKSGERLQALRQLEKKASSEKESQIFIETPYRNNALMQDILQACNDQTLLTVAADISTETEFIRTMNIASWKKKKPELNKRPAVFIIGN